MNLQISAGLAALVLAAVFPMVAASGSALAAKTEREVAADSMAIFRAADAFYAVSNSFKNGGVPDVNGLAKLQPVVSPELHALLVEAGKAEERHTKATKSGEPPMLQGDIFSSLFEGVSAFVVVACENSNFEPAGKCEVKLTYDPKGKPVVWTDTAVVVQHATAWRVGDIEYGGTWAFGNKGKLTDSLKAVIARFPAK